ncbi:hypothetical protein DPQ33_13365 [Oceanidesulfovibrio indonesiensis]|uniref:Methyl-accepting chemotaxis protein n=1 Tax=Oceanidesulfovibrio indonesiensis TaxID=54767 RepID=A0A7M3MCY0_9BACT|nr:HAMP domain-containing methyl-accepting chemotaxis protein [Oceanidesulfovibrio indonesiensis]TVM15953.1 hypothetical protein DPQ33_13365 [Oceanidesulfovibrio indonesiensis]
MTMSIRVRLLFLGIGVILALSVLAGINYFNGRSVSATMEENKRNLQESNLAQRMRENTLTLNLLAMDAIVDRDEGMDQELLAEMQAVAARLRANYPTLRNMVKDPELQEPLQALGPRIDKLVELVLTDLVELIKDSAGALQALEDNFQDIYARMDSQSMQLRAYLQILEQAFLERREAATLPGIWERYDEAVRKVREAQLANVKTLLVALEMLNERHTGEVSAQRRQELHDYGEFLTASIEDLGGYARSGDEKDALANIDELVPSFLRTISVELPGTISESHIERLGIIGAFAGMDDGIDETAGKIDAALGSIMENSLQDLESSSTALETLVTRSSTVGVTIFVVVVAVVAGVMFLIIRSILVPLGRTVDFADAVAAGDLNRELNVRRKDELGRLADALRRMVGELKDKIRQSDDQKREAEEQSARAREAMEEARAAQEQAERAKRQGMLEAAGRLDTIVASLSTSAEQLSAQIEQATRGSAQQSERASETATAMEEMNASVLEVARNASEAAESADSARGNAVDGERVVSEVVTSIQDVSRRTATMKSSLDSLGRRVEEIGNIMNVITDIADQTNLLALNAAIEAARAGEAGRGFAVVADEVRKLAEKTMTATREVGQAITAIQSETHETVDSMDEAAAAVEQSTGFAEQAGAALQKIVKIVEATSDQVRSIATASEQQSSASEEINRAVEDVNRISDETSRGMNEAEQAVRNLAEMSSRLAALIEEMRQG